jgi:nucleoside-diphosphate-sugar epimerase
MASAISQSMHLSFWSEQAMTLSSTVLILGARGRFGLAAARAFAGAGWRVLAQVRPGAACPAVPGVQWLAAALEDSAALVKLAQGAQVVIHALNPPYSRSAWRTQAPALMDAAIGVSRALGATLMLPGNVYNFGASMPALLREDTPQEARHDMGRARIALEQQLARATQDGAMKAVVIRAGDFFGSGTGSWFDQLLAKDLRRGKFSYRGPFDVPTAWVYLPDLASAFVEVAVRREQLPAFAAFHFAGYSVTGQQWAEVMGDIAREQGWLAPGARLRTSSLPLPLLRLGGVVMPTWAALGDTLYLWRTPHRLANDRLTALIGPEPHTPLPQAVRSALAGLGGLSPAQGDAATTA